MDSAFPSSPQGCPVAVLDSTDPATILATRDRLDPGRTLVIVSSKSGTTVETVSLMSYFWNWSAGSLGKSEAARHFAAITDPGTPLAREANRLGFPVFFGNPEVGGRFSALTVFNLFPAALKGIKLGRLLASSRTTAELCRKDSPVAENPGAFLGAALAASAAAGRDKLTFLLPRRLMTFGLWLEQLIAESTGKEGKGLLPVVGEPIGPPEAYGRDRLFIRIEERGKNDGRTAIDRLKRAGVPMLTLSFPAPYGLGGEFFLWEFATAVAGFLLGVNPFDQPDVESAKIKTREILAGKGEHGPMSGQAVPSSKAALRNFLAQARPGDYVAVLAFLPPGPKIDAALDSLRLRLRAATGLAVTVSYGPRYLHSTGQLHKGGRGNGLFLQLVAENKVDVPIPDEPGSEKSSLTFGRLRDAQAAGDFAALRAAGRRILRFHLTGRAEEDIRALAARLPEAASRPG